MRFDTPVTFEKVVVSGPDLRGNRQTTVETVETRLASVTNSALESVALEAHSAQGLGGKQKTAASLSQSALTVRIQGWMKKPFDQMRIFGRTYKAVQRRKLRRLETFVVTEVL